MSWKEVPGSETNAWFLANRVIDFSAMVNASSLHTFCRRVRHGGKPSFDCGILTHFVYSCSCTCYEVTWWSPRQSHKLPGHGLIVLNHKVTTSDEFLWTIPGLISNSSIQISIIPFWTLLSSLNLAVSMQLRLTSSFIQIIKSYWWLFKLASSGLIFCHSYSMPQTVLMHTWTLKYWWNRIWKQQFFSEIFIIEAAERCNG